MLEARPRWFLAIAVGLLSGVMCPIDGIAQTPARVARPIRPCIDEIAGCGIVAIATAAPSWSDEILRQAPQGFVQVLRIGGDYFVATLDPIHPLVRVSHQGQVMAIGRAGGGPGEFRGPLALFGWLGDSVAVFDRAQARLTLVHSSGRIGRSQRFPRQTFGLVAQRNGSVVISAAINQPSAIGLPLHLVDTSGSPVRSLGASDRRFSDRDKALLQHFVTPSSFGVLSVRRAGEYEWDVWDELERSSISWHRTVEWFRPYAEFKDPTRERPPQPHLTAVTSEGDSLMWVAIALPAPNWRRAFGPDTVVEGRPTTPIRDRGALFVTRFELLRVRDGAVLGAVTRPGFYPYFVAPGIALKQTTNGDGALIAEFLQLRRGADSR